MGKRLIIAVTMLLASFAGAWAEGTHYQYEKGSDQHEIYVALTDAEGNILSNLEGEYYIGAFIGDECRGEAEILLYDDQQNSLGNLFRLRVEGDGAVDNGKTISFRIFRSSMAAGGTAEYFIPSTSYSVAFEKNGTTGVPSNPYKIVFVPATNISLQSITVNYGEQLDLLKQITTTPENALIPYPLTWTADREYFTIADNVLTANKVTTEGSMPLSLTAGTETLQLVARTTITVDNPATAFEWTAGSVTKDASDASKGTIKVAVDDGNTLPGILSSGYALTGKDPQSESTTTYSWASSNETVVGSEASPAGGPGILTPLAVGTAILTGTPEDGSTATNPSLTVNVVQPVTDFYFGANSVADTILVVQVGDNVTDRLAAMVRPYPNDATDKTYTISRFPGSLFAESDGKIVAKASNWDGLSPIEVNPDTANTLTITANDGFYAEKQITVYVIPAQPTAITAKEATIYMVTPDELPADISNQLYGNLQLTPDTMLLSDYRIYMQSDSRDVIQPSDGEDEYGRQMFSLIASGEATMTVTMYVPDNLNIQTELSETGAHKLNIYLKELTATFKVVARDGLSEFTFNNNTRAIVGESVEITLVPQPEGVDYDASKISVAVTPAADMPQGWTFAEVAAKAGDATGLKWVITAKSIGNGTITVNYAKDEESKAMGSGTITVDQQLTLSDGWQWISLCQGEVADKAAMRTLFADKLGEIRSASATVYNDPKYGYFGQLSTLDTLQTYKIRMKELTEATKYTIADDNDVNKYFVNNANNDPSGAQAGALSIRANKGWNWIGNPYQYYQQLADIFGNTSFAEGDIIKSKTSFATYTNGAWQGELTYLTPGEGYMFKLANAGNIDFVREFSLTQQDKAPSTSASSRAAVTTAAPWAVTSSNFADNMAMIAYVGGLADATQVTLYAFANGECRGRSVVVGDRHFITIHGEQGERFTFCAYNAADDKFYEIRGSRAFAAVSGSMASPVPLYAGEATSVEAIETGLSASAPIYDLQGRRVGQKQKGIYIQNGKKLIQ
ncbi:MAG: hypothetical protein IJ637_04910 [Prevotella sp.]|nr:hypothetical protein [Prevotella sp.]